MGLLCDHDDCVEKQVQPSWMAKCDRCSRNRVIKDYYNPKQTISGEKDE